MGRPAPSELEDFLSGLHGRKSRGQRAQAAQFINEHYERLREYVEQKRDEGREDLARCYEERIEKFRHGPSGVSYSDALYSIRSFRPSRSVSHSLTFATQHRAARVVGWLLAALIAVMVLWAGNELRKYGQYVFERIIGANEQAASQR